MSSNIEDLAKRALLTGIASVEAVEGVKGEVKAEEEHYGHRGVEGLSLQEGIRDVPMKKSNVCLAEKACEEGKGKDARAM